MSRSLILQSGGYASGKARGMVRGYIGIDNHTHAIATQDGPQVSFRCGGYAPNIGADLLFIANPSFPLCRPCVAAIELEIKGESA